MPPSIIPGSVPNFNKSFSIGLAPVFNVLIWLQADYSLCYGTTPTVHLGGPIAKLWKGTEIYLTQINSWLPVPYPVRYVFFFQSIYYLDIEPEVRQISAQSKHP